MSPCRERRRGCVPSRTPISASSGPVATPPSSSPRNPASARGSFLDHLTSSPRLNSRPGFELLHLRQSPSGAGVEPPDPGPAVMVVDQLPHALGEPTGPPAKPAPPATSTLWPFRSLTSPSFLKRRQSSRSSPGHHVRSAHALLVLAWELFQPIVHAPRQHRETPSLLLASGSSYTDHLASVRLKTEWNRSQTVQPI